MFTCFLLLSTSCAHKTRDINVILRTCDSQRDGCPLNAVYDGPQYYEKVVRLLSGGVPQILYQDLDIILSQVGQESRRGGGEESNGSKHRNSIISQSCESSVREIRSHLRQGKEIAFQIIDSSAKFPSSFLENTAISYGDYDQCLAISSQTSGQSSSQTKHREDGQHSITSWIGSYCMVDFFNEIPPGYNFTTDDGKIHLENNFMFVHAPIMHGYCFPSTCDPEDIRLLVDQVLKPYPYQVKGEVTCDTLETISYSHRLKNITTGQVTAAIVILTVIALVSIGTLMELAVIHSETIDEWSPIRVSRVVQYMPMKSFFACFGLVSNTRELLKQENQNHVMFVDVIKLFVVCAGVFAHLCCCLETPTGFLILSHNKKLLNIIENVFTQFFINDGGLGWVTFLSGFSQYIVLSSIIRKDDLRFGMAIFDRWIRFMPAVMGITCMDIIWPLLFNGPLYGRVGTFIKNKCSSNWIYNVFLMNVYLPALDICAPHTYYSSIDFNMFLLGLLAIYLLTHNERTGISFCIMGVISGNLLLAYFAWYYNVTPAVVVKHSLTQQVVDYLDVVQMSIYSFFCNYFLGILVAFFIRDKGFKVELKNSRQHALWIIMIFMSLNAAEMSPAIHNTFHLLPESLVPLFLVASRGLFTLAVTLLVIYMSSAAATTSAQKAKDRVISETSEESAKDETGCQDMNNNNNIKSDPANMELRDRKVKAEQTLEQQQQPSYHSSSNNQTSGSKRSQDRRSDDAWQQLQTLRKGVKSITARPLIIMSRLSFAIFMSNYFFIRTDFFTSRTLIEPVPYVLLKRVIHSGVLITILAYAFQMIFISPATRLRRMMNYKITYS